MAVNSKNTKAEILAAYKEIEKQKKLLESELKQAQQAKIVRSPSQVKSRSTATVDRSNLDIPNTIKSLQQIKAGFGGAVSQLSEHLITKATELEQIDQAIATQKLELKNLHQLDKIDESTIDLLI